MAPNLIHQRRIDSRADGDASFSQKIFDISVAEIEAIVEPDSVGDDIWQGIGGVCRYSSADSTQIGELSWQYRRVVAGAW